MSGDLKKEADRINKIGDQFRAKKNWKEAIEYYKQSVELANQAGDSRKAENFEKELEEAIAFRGKELNSQGDNLYKQKKWLDAITTYNDAYELLKSAGEKWLKKFGKEFLSELNKAKVSLAKEVLVKEAQSLVQQKKFDDAVKKYEEILKLVSQDIDQGAYNDLAKGAKKFYETYAQDVNNQGDAAYKAKKFEDAIRLYTDSVRLINLSDNDGKKKNFKSELSKAFIEHAQEINNIGDKLMKEGKFMKAADMYKQSVDTAKESGNKKLIENFTDEMEKAYTKFAQQINDKGDGLFKEAQKSGDASKFEEAGKLYANSVAIAKESNNQKLIDNFTKEMHKAYLEGAKLVNSKGDVAFKEGQFKQAYDLYDKSVQLAELSGDKGAIKDFRKERDKAMEKMG